jgi:dihydroorotase
LHIPTVSTAKSVQLIKEAKAKGLQVLQRAVHHLVLTDENWKVLIPDLKFSSITYEREALLRSIDNTIDMITSDHNPMDIEHKKMEFDMAKNGTRLVESLWCSNDRFTIRKVIEKLTSGKIVFSIENHPIAANMSLFTPEGKCIHQSGDLI